MNLAFLCAIDSKQSNFVLESKWSITWRLRGGFLNKTSPSLQSSHMHASASAGAWRCWSALDIRAWRDPWRLWPSSSVWILLVTCRIPKERRKIDNNAVINDNCYQTYSNHDKAAEDKAGHVKEYISIKLLACMLSWWIIACLYINLRFRCIYNYRELGLIYRSTSALLECSAFSKTISIIKTFVFLNRLHDDDVMGYKIFTHEIESSYAARFDYYRSYDTIQRGNYPSMQDVKFSVIGNGTKIGVKTKVSSAIIGQRFP